MYAELPQAPQAIGPLSPWAAPWDLGSVQPPGQAPLAMNSFILSPMFRREKILGFYVELMN